ncbi:DUF192 domain-containing protein [Sphingomonas donggukensis]|uniref:DUF192 domain-containing protein n=1 Tax=Sphingomonas donggukensis TaxID=2949093 RepID=A0ABY4TQ57_9SPHN|nr:DUF192 domain-containing protein [Sphingomonas donggukensis]URW74528.1 DUF192 domain-containing protein [Sphingomonas donggukensis]
MNARIWRGAAIAVGLALALPGCAGGSADANQAAVAKTIPVTITSANGAHVFAVEVAKTAAEQERGLMYRTDLKKDGGMIFAPYPAGGGAPREASFWMKNTPTALDIIFIRPDGTIATIAENTVPFSETPVASGEPVSAVLEILGGRAGELGIAPGDKVSWAK